jgi:hypothetical protein
MKPIFLSIITLFIVTFSIGQNIPQRINYQAVAHDANGNVLSNQSLNVTISILSGSATGTLEYQESHNANTNQFGLFYFKIGDGSVLSGSMAGVNWGSTSHFVNINVDGNDLGTVQLVSVPYALAAASASGINGIPVSNINPTNGNVLVFNGVSGQWEAQAPTAGGGGNAIVTSTPEPSGVNCSNGGFFMEYGTDDNNNGVLDAAEVDGSYYVCNGIEGVDGIDGVSINWIGTLSTAPVTPSLNDGYYNSSLGQSFIWDGTTWQIIGNYNNINQQWRRNVYIYERTRSNHNF